MKTPAIRKIHKTLGIFISPFIILVAFTAILVLLEHNKIIVFPDNIGELILNVHTWSILGSVVVFIVPIFLLTMVITGLIIYR